MPLLLTPTAPLTTTAHLEVASVYAIIEQVSYARFDKRIQFVVGYYAGEAACAANAARLLINALSTTFSLPVTPEQANEVPIFQFLEQELSKQLLELLGEGTTIENVA